MKNLNIEPKIQNNEVLENTVSESQNENKQEEVLCVDGVDNMYINTKTRKISMIVFRVILVLMIIVSFGYIFVGGFGCGLGEGGGTAFCDNYLMYALVASVASVVFWALSFFGGRSLKIFFGTTSMFFVLSSVVLLSGSGNIHNHFAEKNYREAVSAQDCMRLEEGFFNKSYVGYGTYGVPACLSEIRLCDDLYAYGGQGRVSVTECYENYHRTIGAYGNIYEPRIKNFEECKDVEDLGESYVLECEDYYTRNYPKYRDEVIFENDHLVNKEHNYRFKASPGSYITYEKRDHKNDEHLLSSVKINTSRYQSHTPLYIEVWDAKAVQNDYLWTAINKETEFKKIKFSARNETHSGTQYKSWCQEGNFCRDLVQTVFQSGSKLYILSYEGHIGSDGLKGSSASVYNFEIIGGGELSVLEPQKVFNEENMDDLYATGDSQSSAKIILENPNGEKSINLKEELEINWSYDGEGLENKSVYVSFKAKDGRVCRFREEVPIYQRSYILTPLDHGGGYGCVGGLIELYEGGVFGIQIGIVELVEGKEVVDLSDQFIVFK